MNIIVIGAGYVGLVTSACFAELGNQVTCVDVNEEKIQNLKQGVLPIYEPGLDEIIISNHYAGRLHFVTHFSSITIDPQVIFIAVGTPSESDGSANIAFVLNAAADIGANMTHECVIVDKSTVPVGMGDQVRDAVKTELIRRQKDIPFEIVSNPEFLREGQAIEDFMRPDRVIIGLSSDKPRQTILELYLPIVRQPSRIFFMPIKDSEMTKYVANAMLAARISFMNEMAELCSKMGVDVENVRIGIGSDARIGPTFLNAGCGYGGSCFPKDVRALIKMAEQYEFNPLMLQAIEKRNYLQKLVLSEKIIKLFGEDLSKIVIAIWGLSFKPGTDDMREASSLVLLEEVIKRGAHVQAYDPVAMTVAKTVVPANWLKSKQLVLMDQHYDTLHSADILVLVTEWKLFCYPDVNLMKKLMRQHYILDGRNQFDPQKLGDAGFKYYGIGRGS